MNHKRFSLSFSLCVAAFSLAVNCAAQNPKALMKYPAFYKEGHRGTRGLMPENTIPAMIKGLEEGANIVEVDVYLTKDKQVLIAHDPYANVNHTYNADGSEISKEDAKKLVWHQMDYAEIRKLDVGSKPYKDFPQQAKMKAYMPLLGELIDSVEAFTAAHKLKPAIYNIEIKTNPKYDTLGYNAGPEEMMQYVMEVVKGRKIGNRYYIQSFDFRPLQVVHQQYPGTIIGFLTGDAKMTLEQNLATLGFKPDIYSPHYKLVTAEVAAACKAQKMKLVPWTVNTVEEMRALVKLGVDGIITDYPNYFSQL